VMFTSEVPHDNRIPPRHPGFEYQTDFAWNNTETFF
jgi:hypothetical protein